MYTYIDSVVCHRCWLLAARTEAIRLIVFIFYLFANGVVIVRCYSVPGALSIMRREPTRARALPVFEWCATTKESEGANSFR